MNRTRWFFTVASAVVAVLAARVSGQDRPGAPKADPTFQASVQPFFEQHCVRCHGAEKKQGKFALHTFGADVTANAAGYAAILERLQAGDMPPEGEPKPDAKAVTAVKAWIKDRLATDASAGSGEPGLRPADGNRVPHALLFGTNAPATVPPPPRLWRMRPTAYSDGFLRAVRGSDSKRIAQPFDLTPEPGVKDFAPRYAITQPGADVLVRNAQSIVESQTRHTIVKDDRSGPEGRVSMNQDGVREFGPLLHPKTAPTVEELKLAFGAQFRLALVREPTADELDRLIGFYERNVKRSGHIAAAKTALMAPLLMPEAVYRFELGEGKEVRSGVRMLSPKEVAFAVSLALTDRREDGLFRAAEQNQLTSRDEVAKHVRRMLDDPKLSKPRLLGFFREYFGYDAALEVFKDLPDDHLYQPDAMVSDTDRLVLWVLERDRDVLKELLTTPKSFVNYGEANDKGKVTPRPLRKPHPPNHGTRKGPELAYGFPDWPAVQPVDLTGGRIGVLMQPAWLVAWSGNFDNDPVRRGRWVRERLLGGSVPDLPIGVAAKVPDEPHEPLRHRLRVTRAAECWKCHQKMDDLGLPFEGFTHYGVPRTAEVVQDKVATEKNVDKTGKPLGVIRTTVKLDTSGLLNATGDPALDGKVSDAADMARKLAASERVRQVFVRHVFRYYMGRNETAGDAKTLQDADRAYVEGGGSFKALLVSLLSSESFLYRTGPTGR